MDDDIELRREIAKQLRGEGFDVVEAGSVADATMILAMEHIDVIVTDFQMPGEDGTVLSERNQPIPVIVMTAMMERDPLMKAAQSSTAGFIYKPFQIGQLILIMIRAFAQRDRKRLMNWLFRKKK